MAEVIRMPKMSDTMEEGVIAAWSVKVGDKIKSGDILAEVETDKATMDMESYSDGTILHIGVEKGQAVPIDAIIAVIGQPGEDFQSLLNGGAAAPKAETPAKSEEPVAVAAPAAKIDTSSIKATVITMPLLSDTMTEGVIHTWLKKLGDDVKSGEMLAEIETDKATMEIEAYESGKLLYIGVEAGQAAPVNAVIAVIGEAGADYKTLIAAQTAGSVPAAAASPSPVAEAPKSALAAAPAAKVEASAPAATNTNGRVMASPLAKSIAKDKGISLDQVKGSGEGGRIVKSDVDNFKPSAAAPVAASAGSAPVFVASGVEKSEEVAPSQMRKAITKGLTRNKFLAPEFFITMEINMDRAMAARAAMNETSPVKISFNDMVIKACAGALRKHPNVNSSWKNDMIIKNHHIHIGMAVAIEDGLVVPVIRFADTLSLSQLSANAKDLGGKAKNKQLQPKDWEGNTFTVSNLGMFGVDEFTSIINNPDNESCILAVGGIKETVAVKNGQFYATNVMKVTLTCDHRIVDGAQGAAFLVTLKELLEEPYKMLV
ncbi:MAG: 2-oxo acid dehydrogenase subunit E2 [Leadbetterella sp.]